MEYEQTGNHKYFTEAFLKILAVFSMAVDHVGTIFFSGIRPLYLACDGIGRLAFPIFCFCLTESFFHTSDRKRYAFRLLFFAVLSEIPYDLAFFGVPFYWEKQNIFLTLFLGFAAISIWDSLGSKWYLQLPAAALCCLAAYFLHADYTYMGVISILVFYLFHEDRRIQCAAGAISFAYEWPSVFAFPFLWFYNGKRGRQNKYFFYLFYPGHLLLLFALRRFLFP